MSRPIETGPPQSRPTIFDPTSHPTGAWFIVWGDFANDHMNCTVFGRSISADAVQGSNPLFVLVLIPAVRLLRNSLEACGVAVSATHKLLIRFVLTAGCMGLMAAAATIAAATGSKVTVWWQIGAYLLLTVAEIMIGVTGLELAYGMAPAGAKSVMTAVWMSTAGVANLVINAPFTRLYGFVAPAVYFGLLAALLLIAAAIFHGVMRCRHEATGVC